MCHEMAIVWLGAGVMRQMRPFIQRLKHACHIRSAQCRPGEGWRAWRLDRKHKRARYIVPVCIWSWLFEGEIEAENRTTLWPRHFSLLPRPECGKQGVIGVATV